MNNSSKYALNFVIPKGEKGITGPTGEQGPQGPTGPMGPSCLEALFFAEFAPKSKMGNLNIGQNIILPDNTDIFQIQGDYKIKINEPGLYEITLSGALKNLIANEQISILLQNESSTLNSIEFNTNTCTNNFFSQTFLHEFNSSQTLGVLLQKVDTNVSAIDNSNIIIKKLPL